MRPTRDLTYLVMALTFAERSTCIRRAVGCILVDKDGFPLSMGYNGVAASRPHRGSQLSICHSVTVIQDPDARVAVSKVTIKRDAPGSGFDAVVNQIGECAWQIVVAETAGGSHQRSRIRGIGFKPHVESRSQHYPAGCFR